MSFSVKNRLKQWPHDKVERHFLIMCGILPYGGTLRGCRLGHRIVRHINPVRWPILDAVEEVEDVEWEWIKK